MMKNGKILIVDDDILVNNQHTSCFQIAGFSTDSATDVATAWQRVQTGSFDCVFLDHDLPDGKGVNLLRRLADHNIRIPVIYLTAAPQNVRDSVSEWENVVRVLAKPARENELILLAQRWARTTTRVTDPGVVSAAERSLLLPAVGY